MTAPRPGDAFYLDVTYPDGDTTRFTIEALDVRDAFHEASYILGGCGDVYVPPEHRDPTGSLRRANGDLVTAGRQAHFEEMS